MPEQYAKGSEQDVIQTALERFKLAAEADSAWRAECLDDLDFSTGNQWPLTMETIRTKDGRPCLVMDQIQQSIRLVCNQYRQQPPSITVNPVGDGADVDTAEVLQGVFRHVEVNCDAQVVYENTHEGMVRTGFHSCRLLSDYVDNDSDEQEIVIDWIRNAFSVYWQPGVPQEKARWAFIVADIPWDTYHAEYGDDATSNSSDFTSTGNAAPTWVNKEYVRVAEYFEVLDVERKAKRPGKKVIWRKITAFKILDGGAEGRRLPGTSIPIFTAYGDDIDVDGKRYVAGLVRNAKGPQRQYNYMVSGATEAISLAPKAPWIAAEGQLAGKEGRWEQSNVRNFAVLTYKQVDVAGKPAPPPQRNNVEPPIQGLAHMIAQASLDLKAALGIYDPSLGQRKGDESGKAIERLQQQGSIATLNYADNMSRMMRRLGRSLLEWVREIYDTPRIQRIINPDGSVKQVIIHNGPDQAQNAQMLAEQAGIKKIYDIGTGKYDVVISVGPTYQSKRQEAVATQMDLLKVLPPQVSQNLADLVVRNMDIPQSKEMADRIKKMLPPQFQDGDESDPEVQLQKAQAQLQQLAQQHDLLTKALTDATDQIKTKQAEQQGKIEITKIQEESRQTIEQAKIAAQIAIAEVNTKVQDTNQRIQWLQDVWSDLHNAAHERAMQETQQAHEQGMATQQQGADAAAQASDQQQAQTTQASDQAHESEMATANQGAEENA